MATKNQAGASGQAAALPTEDKAPTLRRFAWVERDHGEKIHGFTLVDHASKTRDMAAGLAVVVRMLEQDDLDQWSCDEEGNAVAKLLDPADRGNLFRLAVTGLEVLTQQAADALEFVTLHRQELAVRKSNRAGVTA